MKSCCEIREELSFSMEEKYWKNYTNLKKSELSHYFLKLQKNCFENNDCKTLKEDLFKMDKFKHILPKEELEKEITAEEKEKTLNFLVNEFTKI